jgi:ribosome-associated protein
MAKSDRSRKKSPAGLRLPEDVRAAIGAIQDKKGTHIVVLDLRPSAGFTDYFVVCSGQNVRQVHAIADSVKQALDRSNIKPSHTEGYDRAEWVLLDYFDFVVHVFSPETRNFYDLERLWGSAERIEIPEEIPS